MSKLSGMLRAMDAHVSRNAPEPGWMAEDCQFAPQDSAVCAIADCDEPAAVTCVCCNRRVCFYDISGAVLDIPPGLCCDCLAESA